MSKKHRTRRACSIKLPFLLAGLLMVAAPQSAAALPKTIVMGGNPAGSLYYSIAAGLSKVVTTHTPMKVEVLAQGANTWYPMMGTGEVQLGVANPCDAIVAYRGEEVYKQITKGKGHPYLRAIMVGTPMEMSIVVPADHPARKISDLKGRKVVTEFGTYFTTTMSTKALLANGGLTFDDVKGVKVTTIVDGVRAVIEGRAEAATIALGAGIVEELKAAKGARFLPVDPSPAAMERTRKIFTGFFPNPVKAGKTGVQEDMNVLGYGIELIASSQVGEDVVYSVTKAIWENHAELAPLHPELKKWTPDRFCSTQAVLPYHPGAIKFYKEKGVWSQQMEEHQRKLVAAK